MLSYSNYTAWKMSIFHKYKYFSSFEAWNCASNFSFKWMKNKNNLEIQRYWVRILVCSDICHRGCAYTPLQSVQRPGTCVLSTVLSRSGIPVSRKQKFLPHSLVKIRYCGEPPWPRGSVLGFRPLELEFRIMCLEDSVISFVLPPLRGSHGPV